MGYSLREIVKVPKNEKSTLIKFRIVSWIFVPAVLAISAISGYWLILNWRNKSRLDLYWIIISYQ